ncbi:MAG: hypothetical protein IPG63_05175 [Xanthomonadales bacterium]|nr:hypothetical protein [Xanthomonadales bacterium]
MLVNQGERFVAAPNGTALKKNDRVMAMEDSSATVKYFEGCEIAVKAGTVITIPELLPCECGDFSREQGPIGRIAEANGALQLVRGESLVEATAGQQVAVDDIVRTLSDARAVVEFRDGCRTEVAASSEYRIPDRSPCLCAIIAAQQVGPATNYNLARILGPSVLLLPRLFEDDDDEDLPVSP